jgi:hypothetical protein
MSLVRVRQGEDHVAVQVATLWEARLTEVWLTEDGGWCQRARPRLQSGAGGARSGSPTHIAGRPRAAQSGLTDATSNQPRSVACQSRR